MNHGSIQNNHPTRDGTKRAARFAAAALAVSGAVGPCLQPDTVVLAPVGILCALIACAFLWGSRAKAQDKSNRNDPFAGSRTTGPGEQGVRD